MNAAEKPALHCHFPLHRVWSALAECELIALYGHSIYSVPLDRLELSESPLGCGKG